MRGVGVGEKRKGEIAFLREKTAPRSERSVSYGRKVKGRISIYVISLRYTSSSSHLSVMFSSKKEQTQEVDASKGRDTSEEPTSTDRIKTREDCDDTEVYSDLIK